MKFNKLIFGLAAFPLLLTSCNSAMSRDAVSKWIGNHYKEENDAQAWALTEWNFEGVKGERAADIVKTQIYPEIVTDSENLIDNLSDLLPEEKLTTSGHEHYVTDSSTITPLNETTFGQIYLSTSSKDDVFKVSGNSLNITYKRKYLYEKPKEDDPDTWKYVTTTNVRVFNSKGYCTDYGCKVDGKWIDKNNSIKFKVTFHFTYPDDPID